MRITRTDLIDHFKFLSIKGLSVVNVNEDGSYACVTDSGAIAIKAPPLEDYEAENQAFITDIAMFYKVIKNLVSPEGSVELTIEEDLIKFKTSQIEYSYVLGDKNSVSKVYTSEDIDELVENKEFSDEYQLTPTLIKNIVQMIDTLSGDKVTITSTNTGFKMKVLGNLHSGHIDVAGQPLSIDKLVIEAELIQDVLKSFSNDAFMNLRIDNSGDLIVFTSEKGFKFYVSTAEDVI